MVYGIGTRSYNRSAEKRQMDAERKAYTKAYLEGRLLPEKIADWPDKWRELYEERAGIMEFAGNISKATAESLAEKEIRRRFMEGEK